MNPDHPKIVAELAATNDRLNQLMRDWGSRPPENRTNDDYLHFVAETDRLMGEMRRLHSLLATGTAVKH